MKYLIFLVLLSFNLNTFSQQWQWARSYGGHGTDSTTDFKMREGFLYITGTFTSSEIKWENNTLLNKGGKDIFVAKLDTNGKTIWVKSFGDTGDDIAEQVEVNKNGCIVLRCKSTSASLKIGNDLLIKPSNFFIGLDKNGNQLNAANLAEGVTCTDIAIDYSGSTYVAIQYQQPFNFKNKLIDTLFSYAGAALLKYDAEAKPEWYKNIEVCDNDRYLNYYYKNDPLTPPGPGDEVYYYYPSPQVEYAKASFEISYNELDTLIAVNCLYTANVSFFKPFNDTLSNFSFFNYYYYYDVPSIKRNKNFQFTSTTDGEIKLAKFNDSDRDLSTYFESDDVFLKFSPSSGKSFSATYSHTHNSQFYFSSIEIADKNNILKKKGWLRFPSMYGDENLSYILPESMQVDKFGQFILLFTTADSVQIFDTSLSNFKSFVIPQRKRIASAIYYPEISLINSCFSDTTSIYLGSHFSDSCLILNDQLPSESKTLSNYGGKDIFIGKLSLAGKHIQQQIQNVSVCRGGNYIFPDGNTINSIGADTTYTSNLTTTQDEDSIITTKISVIKIDTSIIQNQNTLTANNSHASYQWINSNDGSPINFETAQAFTSNKTGNFALVITENGCIDTSATYAITLDDLPGHKNYLLYPVPASDDITIEIKMEENITANLLIVDFSGKPLITKKISLTTGGNKIVQSLRTLNKGGYTLILQIDDSKKLISKKIIKM